ncbi:MAG: hypothetical protein ABIW19_16375 [Vicinamibacterales bacterium]
MRRLKIRSLSLPALAFVLFTGNAAAQENSPALLNTLEVQQLVKRAEPGDNARLAAHFTALADRHTAEAKRHTAMGKASIGNPSRSLGTSIGAHCNRLAVLDTQSATALRELATYHQKLASGAIATPPAGAARFEGGAGAPVPTEQELNAMAAKASSPADHHALEEYFQTLAKRYTAEGKEHAAMAAAYQGTRIAQAAVHCDRLIELSRDLAKEANAAATMHKDLAGVAR